MTKTQTAAAVTLKKCHDLYDLDRLHARVTLSELDIFKPKPFTLDESEFEELMSEKRINPHSPPALDLLDEKPALIIQEPEAVIGLGLKKKSKGRPRKATVEVEVEEEEEEEEEEGVKIESTPVTRRSRKRHEVHAGEYADVSSSEEIVLRTQRKSVKKSVEKKKKK